MKKGILEREIIIIMSLFFEQKTIYKRPHIVWIKLHKILENGKCHTGKSKQLLSSMHRTAPIQLLLNYNNANL